MSDINKIRQEYDKVKSAITTVVPFISSLLSRVRIVLDDSIGTAGVSEYGVLAIAPSFWSRLSWSGKAWILAHETLHIAFRDHERLGNKNTTAWNLCTDAVNNSLIEEFLKMPNELKMFSITLDKIWDLFYDIFESQNISYNDLIRMSKEELYKYLPKINVGGEKQMLTCPKCGSERIIVKKLTVNGDRGVAHFSCSSCGFEWDEEVTLNKSGGDVNIPIDDIEIDIGKDISDGEVLQEGDPEIYKDGKEGEESDEKWKDNIARAYDIQKTAGFIPAGLKRIVDKLLQSKVDWRSLLRQSLRNGFGRTIVSTYKRPSRKCDDYPGLRRFTYPTVWCLIDQSASISNKEATQFISEVYSIVGNNPVEVVVWDSIVYDVIEAKSKSEIINKVIHRLRGGGGTVVAPSLKTTLNRMRNGDVVILFTDGKIHDLEDQETKMLLNNVATKSSVAIFCSTYREVELEGWRFIKLELNH